MGVVIVRDPSVAAARHFDLIVIGGGIYGACLAMEAARRGLTPLLVERNDFGGGTTWNSLRIIHGGLRYLQTLDLRRHSESVQERRWFLREFPDLVRPLPCLMPLYRNGLKRPTVLRAALRLNDVLSWYRNAGVDRMRRLADGRIISATDTRLMFPAVKRNGLQGAALWHDAVMVCPQRILMEILLAAHQMSPEMMSLNYTEAAMLLTQSHGRQRRISGVAAIDRLTRETFEYRAPIVINAAGPWCEHLSDGSRRRLYSPGSVFRPSLAYNLLIDRAPLCDAAVAVSSGRANGRIYFIHKLHSGLALAGTEHVPIHDQQDRPEVHYPSAEQIERTVAALNEAVPGWNVTTRDVLRVYSGVLPVRKPGTVMLTSRPAVVDHARRGGAAGLYSVAGVKFTTARLVAEKVITRIVRRGANQVREFERDCEGHSDIDLIAPDEVMEATDDCVRHAIRRVVERESVLTIDDLLLRRTGWLDDPRQERAVRDRVVESLPPQCGEAVRAPGHSARRLMEGRREAAILPVRSPH